MKHTFTLGVSCFVILFYLQSCNAVIERPTVNSGSLELGELLVIGDEFAAGFANGGLYEEAQENSAPYLLADQLSEVSPFQFRQALLEREGTGHMVLESMASDNCPMVSLRPNIGNVDSVSFWSQRSQDLGPYHNLAFPQLKISDLNHPNKLMKNPFYARIQASDSIGSFAKDLLNYNPDILILWIGINELLIDAKNGKTPDEILAPDSLEQILSDLVAHASHQNPQLPTVLVNFPDITHFPYFRALDFIYTDPGSCNERDIYISTQTGVRLAKETDRILLPAREILEVRGVTGYNTQNPLPDSLVLDESEVFVIQSILSEYNLRILELSKYLSQESPGRKIALLDIHDEMEKACTVGIQVDGLVLTGDYLTGGIFSLDGLHFTPRGNAHTANMLIKKINGMFGSTIPTLNISDFEGVSFP